MGFTGCLHLKVLCDEVFGRANFISNVIWQKRTSRENRAAIGSSHDHILLYAKMPATRWKDSRNLLPSNEEGFSNPDNDPKGPWRSIPFSAQGWRPNQMYKIVTPTGIELEPPKGRCWGATEAVFKGYLNEGRVYFPKGGDGRPRIKTYAGEEKGLVPNSIFFATEAGDNQAAKKEAMALFPNDTAFSTPKPEKLLNLILSIATNTGDLVLDSFAGSGTTGAVAHKMNRKWIMCEFGEHCHTHIIPRMQKVVDGEDKGGVSETVGWKHGGGFKYYKLAEALLVKDKDLSTNNNPVYTINPRYDDTLLIKSICKIENFRYRNNGRLHGISSENRFLHVTTRIVTQAYLESLAEDINKEQSLLIYCTRKSRHIRLPENVEIKKIPKNLLEKCDFEEDKR